MLSEHIASQGVQVWLVNTGWIQGGYGVGPRIPLKYTRALIQAVLDGYWSSKEHTMIPDPVFGFNLPASCPGIPEQVLHPDLGWSDAAALSAARKKLAGWFNNHFAQFSADASVELIAAGPRV
jgi:phosphoenolpyruvate carboxykinase (ATP)